MTRLRPTALWVLAMLALNACSIDVDPTDLRALERSSAPNDALSCPAELCQAKPDFDSPVYPIPTTDLMAILREVLSAQPRTKLVGEAAELNQLVFVQRSALFRFPDTIWAQGVSVAGESSIILYSRSNYGHWDLGVNRRRVGDWLDRLDRAVDR